MSRPIDYLPLVSRAVARWAGAYGVRVPVELVLAVMRRENAAADPAKVTPEPSRPGHSSYGLMQVLDTTAVELGYRNPRELLDPAAGVDAGVHYLAKQLARYGGRLAPAVAAYNAGTARYTQSGAFINQGYVDDVVRFFRELGGSPATSAAVLTLALMGVGLFFGGAMASAPRRRRRRRAA